MNESVGIPSKLWLHHLSQQRAIAVVRASQPEVALALAEVAIAAGWQNLEITATTPEFATIIAQVRQQHAHGWIGVGTVLDAATAHRAIDAGAQFLFSPYCLADVMAVARQRSIPVVPGALTPQEIGTAWQMGATAVKVFPVQSVGGPQYLQALRGPLGHIPLIPTGGVTLANAREFWEAGAVAVGLASDLFPHHWVESRDWEAIAARIRSFLSLLPDRSTV